jgi:hypothetical protein
MFFQEATHSINSYFINNIFPDLKIAYLNFRNQKTQSTFWVHRDNPICHNGSTVTLKKKNNIPRMSHPPHSLDISPCTFWLFGILKQILRYREFSASNEIEGTIAQVSNDLTFDDIQSVIPDWIRRIAWIAENDGEYISDQTRFASSCRLHVEVRMGAGNFLGTLEMA